MQAQQKPSAVSLLLFAAMALSLSMPPISAFSVSVAPPSSRISVQPLHYANTADPHAPFDQGQDKNQRHHDNNNNKNGRNNDDHSHNAGDSFEQRMRNLLKEERRKQQQQKDHLNRQRRAQHVFGSRPSQLQEVDTIEDYKRVVVDESSKLTVVRFYAPFCKACRAATPAFDSLMRQYQDDSESIQFVEVPITKENAELHQALGVKSIPFGHIYHPSAGLVEELRMVRPQMQKFKNILQTYTDGQVDLPESVNPETGIFEAPY